MKVICLQCGHEFELIKSYQDNLGCFTVCPKCDGSFDIDIESTELTKVNDNNRKD